jgi:hypothetical protein
MTPSCGRLENLRFHPGVENRKWVPRLLESSYYKRPFRLTPANCQSQVATLDQMQKATAKRRERSSASNRQYRTTEFHLPKNLWELLSRVAFERARTKGGRASVSALLVRLVERHRKELELELAELAVNMARRHGVVLAGDV